MKVISAIVLVLFLAVNSFAGAGYSPAPLTESEKAGYATTGTVGAIDVRVTVVETGKLDKVEAASTYATTGTVGAIDVRVTGVETGKADLVHSHAITDVTDLQSNLAGKVSTNESRDISLLGSILMGNSTSYRAGKLDNTNGVYWTIGTNQWWLLLQ